MVGLKTSRIGKWAPQKKPSRKKPVYISYEEMLTETEKRAIRSAAFELLESANADGMLVVDFGAICNCASRHTESSRASRHIDSSLAEYECVEWYIQNAVLTPDELKNYNIPCTATDSTETSKADRKKLSADRLLESLVNEPWRDLKVSREYHYDFLVVHSELYSLSKGGGRLVRVTGIAEPGIAAVLSTAEFKDIDAGRTRYEFVKLEALHQLGHMFGLEDCEDLCTMKKEILSHDERIAIISYNIKNKTLFCERCAFELDEYFRPTLYSKLKSIFTQ